MQKLRFVNGNGVEIDLTAGRYGITEWSGFSNADLNIQSQQVPFQDGAVFLDALYNPRELSVTVAINDDNDLSKRYELKRELISVLNAKLGEGYLYYKNDYLERRIKVIPQLPIFENKNSNDSGTLKASLSWTAPEVYWEDVEETTVTINSYEQKIINNKGDVPCSIQVEGINTNTPFRLFNNTNEKKIATKEDIALSFKLNTGLGKKSFVKGGFGKVFEVGIITSPFSITFNPITNQYVMLTSNGIWVCDDEENWYLKNENYSGIGFVFYDEDNNYYIVGASVNKIYTTEDLINFTQVGTVTGICYGIWKIDSMYIISTHSNTYYGSDLSNLTLLYVEPSFTAFEKNGSIYVIGKKYTHIYSSDSWTSTSHGKTVTNASNNGDYVVIQTTAGLYHSNNYTTWTQITSDTSAENPIYSSLLYKWMYTDNTTLYISSDLSTWETLSIDWGNTSLLFIETSENKDLMFVQLSANTYIKQIKTTDLTNFIISDIGCQFSGSTECYMTKDEDSLYLAIGGEAGGKCFIYKKTTSWELVSTLDNVFLGKFKYVLDKFIIFGFGTVYVSENLENWDTYSITANDVIYTNYQYVFVGYNGTITITTDFISFQIYNFLTTDNLLNINYCNGYYYIVCGSGIAYSTDAINWNWLYPVSMSITKNSTCVYDDKLYIANNNQVIIVDSLNYSNISFTQEQNYFKIFYSNVYNCFILAGSSKSYITTDFKTAYTLPFSFSTLEEFENEIYVTKEALCFSLEIEAENSVSDLTLDSDMTLGLEVGENKFTITGQINGVYYLTYRQKYLGV